MESPRSTNAATWSDELIELLERQHGLVEELSSLAARQAVLVERRQTDALLALLDDRERIIAQFTRSQEEMNRFTTDLDTRLDDVAEADRTRIQDLIGRIGDRLGEVMQRDAEDQQVLETARGDVKNELSSLNRSRQARHAYQGSRGGAATNKFADQRG
ncbi:MAG: flagellar export chaperone FlgN [Planctomycetota bacterium]|jgi:flagellar biosynthesis/type III secretory pathway chaperone